MNQNYNNNNNNNNNDDDEDIQAYNEYMKTVKDMRISFLTLLISLFLMCVFNVAMMYFR